MPGHEYEPKDSRDVTRQQNTPGKPTKWREKEDATEEDDASELAPNDSREVTAHQNAPGKPTGWQDKEGEGAGAETTQPDPGLPPGVRQERPFSAKEAAATPLPPD